MLRAVVRAPKHCSAYHPILKTSTSKESHMSTSPNGGDIIIKGSSVEIEFNEQTFSGKGGKYSNKNKSIASVEVTDHNTNQTQTVTIPANGKCTIRITTR